MKRRSFFKSIAAVFGAVAAAPAVALTKSPVPVVAPPVEPPTKRDFSGNYIINGEQCFVEADGTVVRWDKEEKNFTFGEKRNPMPIHQYNGNCDYWRERELKVS